MPEKTIPCYTILHARKYSLASFSARLGQVVFNVFSNFPVTVDDDPRSEIASLASFIHVKGLPCDLLVALCSATTITTLKAQWQFDSVLESALHYSRLN